MVKHETVKRAFQRFCDGTSCHGYAELYHAKAKVWHLLWILVCGVALGLTVAMVYYAVNEFFNSSTDTVTLPVTEDDMLYPPIFLCFRHWIQWVDFQKIKANNFEKSAILYGLNYFTPIFSVEKYDVDVAQENFENFMKNHQLKTLLSFYNFIAKWPPPIEDANVTSYFDSSRVVFDKSHFYYCYVMSSNSVKSYFGKHSKSTGKKPSRKLMPFSYEPENYNTLQAVEYFLSAEEYIEYMKQWISDSTDWSSPSFYSNLINFAPSLHIFPNGFDDNYVNIMEDIDAYHINFQATCREWLSTDDQPCIDDYQSVGSNETCELNCLALAQKESCLCLDLHFSTYLSFENSSFIITCRKNFYTLDSNGMITLAAYNKSNNTQAYQSCKNDIVSSDTYNNCYDQCNPACRIWSWYFNVLTSPMPIFAENLGLKQLTEIYIEYPMSEDLAATVEEVGQTWQSFVGNIGGLLGIWTGASIVSLVQLFYLCCFADMDHVPGWTRACKKKHLSAASKNMSIVEPQEKVFDK